MRYFFIILVCISTSVSAQRINYAMLPTFDSVSATDYFPALRAPNTQYKATFKDLIDLMRDSIAGASIDTANKWVNTIFRVPGKDSIFFQIGSTVYKIKDSTGSSAPEWGTITGDLDAQTDLYNALLLKKDVADSGRANSNYITGWSLNKVRDSLQSNVDLKKNISDSGRAVSNYVTGWSLNKVRDSLATLVAKKQDTAAWVDYSATSTITGWSSYTTKLIQYQVVGNIMRVMVQIEGTGTGTSVSFTLPNSATAWGTQYFILHTRNNTTQSASVATVAANGSTVTVSNSASTTSSWTNGVGRDVQGQFFINIQ